MIIPDVNVLVPLHRRGHTHHQRAQAWWQDFASTDEPLTVPDVIWSGFVRVVTHPRILRPPSPLKEAWQFVEAVRVLDTYIQYASHPRLMDLFAAQCKEASATADLVTDAYIAAAAIAVGATVVTFDRDFRRFDGLCSPSRLAVLRVDHRVEHSVGITRRASTSELAPCRPGSGLRAASGRGRDDLLGDHVGEVRPSRCRRVPWSGGREGSVPRRRHRGWARPGCRAPWCSTRWDRAGLDDHDVDTERRELDTQAVAEPLDANFVAWYQAPSGS